MKQILLLFGMLIVATVVLQGCVNLPSNTKFDSETNTLTVEIGPYPDSYACDFYQSPFPGVNKKMVSCPYETPGAAANQAADAYCQNLMGPNAKAESCDETGMIICSHPCNLPGHVMPTTCPFDTDRPRGSQAEVLSWCQPTEPPEVQDFSGKPDNCEETFPPGHEGYAQNKETWDLYTTQTNGVCQSIFGRGIPSPCEYTVQLSKKGNPYYICWYN